MSQALAFYKKWRKVKKNSLVRNIHSLLPVGCKKVYIIVAAYFKMLKRKVNILGMNVVWKQLPNYFPFFILPTYSYQNHKITACLCLPDLKISCEQKRALRDELRGWINCRLWMNRLNLLEVSEKLFFFLHRSPLYCAGELNAVMMRNVYPVFLNLFLKKCCLKLHYSPESTQRSVHVIQWKK